MLVESGKVNDEFLGAGGQVAFLKLDYQNNLLTTFTPLHGVKIQKYDVIDKQVLRELKSPTGC